MISLQAVAQAILYLVVGAVCFGIFYWIIDKVGVLCGPASEPFVKVAKIILLIAAGFICIGVLLSMVSGQPLFKP